MRATIAAALLLLTLAASQPASAAYGTGTTSTGNIDTWGLTSAVPPVRTCGTELGKLHIEHACIDPFVMCPQDFFVRKVTLTLLQPSPGDLVSLTVAERPAFPGDSIHANDPTTGIPVAHFTVVQDFATYDNPVAEVHVHLGGCNRIAEAIVTGIHVNGEIGYTIEY